MLFLGIDQSLTATGIVVIDENYKIILKELISTPTKGVERLFHIELSFLEIIKELKVDFSSIEGGAFRESGRIFQLGQLSGMLQLNLFKKAIPFIEVAPLAVKKYVSGVGKNKGKETIILDVFKNFNEEIRDDNIADAYILARIARDYYNAFIIDKSKKLELKQYQTDVLNVLYKSQRKDSLL